jgi:simple sugar transport system ATP-binding protein
MDRSLDVPLLRLVAVSKRFGGVIALDHVDWDVRAGEVHCLVGENGCGKSTLIKIVSGVYQPDEGAIIEMDGKPVQRLTPAHAKALGIQVIFQDLSLFPNLSVAENIAIDQSLGAYLRPVRRQRMRMIARHALDRLQFKLPLETAVSNLSVAERQVVAISRGLVTKARLLFMDEPTASLSRVEVNRLLEIVRRLTEQKIAVVFVSHRLDEVIEVAERVTVLRDGKKVGTMRASDVDQKRIGQLMTGLDFEETVVAQDVGSAAPVLEVAGLSRHGEYQDISLTIRRGEVVGLIGLLGAGRTELALSLFGMTRPDAGTLQIDGVAVAPGSNRDAIAAGIAYLSEDRLKLGLNLPQSVADNMILTVLNRLVGGGGLISVRRRKSFVAEWIRKLSIKAPEPDQPVSQLSGGNQQRVVLAKWLATEPKVLILDSPTVGVDIKNKQEIYRIIRDLARRGVAILLISDEAPEVMATCDRVLIMRSGRLLREIGPARLAESDMAERIEEQIYA